MVDEQEEKDDTTTTKRQKKKRQKKSIMTKKEVHLAAQQKSGTDEALLWLAKEDPINHTLFRRSMENNLKAYFQVKMRAEQPNAHHHKPMEHVTLPFRVPAGVRTWLDSHFHTRHVRKKTLILLGDTQLGKTSWAQSLTPNHIYMQGNFCHEKMDHIESTDLLVMDDVSFRTIPARKKMITSPGSLTWSSKWRVASEYKVWAPIILAMNTLPYLDARDEHNGDASYMDHEYTIVVLIRAPLFYTPVVRKPDESDEQFFERQMVQAAELEELNRSEGVLDKPWTARELINEATKARIARERRMEHRRLYPPQRRSRIQIQDEEDAQRELDEAAQQAGAQVGGGGGGGGDGDGQLVVPLDAGGVVRDDEEHRSSGALIRSQQNRDFGMRA